MIAIVDYGMGNLKSIYKALKYVNADCMITSNPGEVSNADGVVLPGVGAFKDAMECIKGSGLEKSIKSSVQQGKPFLGICLGMQLLFDLSFENGKYPGLSIIRGQVNLIQGNVKIPHMGWNNLEISNPDDPLLHGLNEPIVYFVHSYCCIPENKDIISSSTEYGCSITASIWQKNVHALQFHPEKSGDTGLKILNNFGRMVK